MTAVHARAARRERQGAEVLGTRRVIRKGRHQRAPDNYPVRLKDGTTLQPESKSRKALPKWITAAIAQARGYNPAAVPLVYVCALGGEQLAVLPLKDFARIAGIASPKAGEQLALGVANTPIVHFLGGADFGQGESRVHVQPGFAACARAAPADEGAWLDSLVTCPACKACLQASAIASKGAPEP